MAIWVQWTLLISQKSSKKLLIPKLKNNSLLNLQRAVRNGSSFLISGKAFYFRWALVNFENCSPILLTPVANPTSVLCYNEVVKRLVVILE
jgi:hypothetical protein